MIPQWSASTHSLLRKEVDRIFLGKIILLDDEQRCYATSPRDDIQCHSFSSCNFSGSIPLMLTSTNVKVRLWTRTLCTFSWASMSTTASLGHHSNNHSSGISAEDQANAKTQTLPKETLFCLPWTSSPIDVFFGEGPESINIIAIIASHSVIHPDNTGHNCTVQLLLYLRHVKSLSDVISDF